MVNYVRNVTDSTVPRLHNFNLQSFKLNVCLFIHPYAEQSHCDNIHALTCKIITTN